MTTDLAAALKRHHDSEGFCVCCSSERVFEPWPCDAARAREEIAWLREDLEAACLAMETATANSRGQRCVIETAACTRNSEKVNRCPVP
jgi:hypothetical protein